MHIMGLAQVVYYIRRYTGRVLSSVCPFCGPKEGSPASVVLGSLLQQDHTLSELPTISSQGGYTWQPASPSVDNEAIQRSQHYRLDPKAICIHTYMYIQWQ